MSTADPLVIDRFQVQRLLGRTSSHLVYLARDPKQKRPVTLTTPVQGSDMARARRQCQLEWVLSRRLSHPGIQKVLDHGYHPDFGPFLIKEYLKGVNLAVLLEDRLPPQATLHLLVQLAHALQAAAKAGVVHGDIKPENIFVDFEGRLTLMDFHASTQEEDSDTPVYVSPGYAAPELLIGQPPSFRSDLFSFAVTAFQMWTGELPFGGGDPETMLKATRDREPLFPTDMPIAMRMLFQNALEKNPAARTLDVQGFMERLIDTAGLHEHLSIELKGLLAGKPAAIRGLAPFLAKHVHANGPQTEASPCATRPLVPEEHHRNWKVLVAAVVVPVCFLAGFALWKGMPRRVGQPSAPAESSAMVPPPAPPLEKPKGRTITVRTEPSEAEILLDGVTAGLSPQEELEIGKARQMLVRRDGYQDQSLDLDGNQPLPDPIRLQPLEATPNKPVLPVRVALPTKTPTSAKPPAKDASKPARRDEFNLYEQLRKQEGR